MNKRSLIMLRVLINRYNPKAGNALLKFLPPDKLKKITELEVRSTDLTPMIKQPDQALSTIHFSWIEPLLEQFPEYLKSTVVGSLTPEQKEGLKASTSLSVSPLVKSFILTQLYRLLKIEEHFPLEYLSENELTSLVHLSKPKLVNLIDFLGLHDLASEVRYIVDRNQLKNIYDCLSSQQLQYLKKCLHQKEQITSPKMGLDLSKQDCTKLKQTMHKRGILRLSRALCGQQSDFVWHIAHILDRGRGAILMKEYQPEEMPKVTSILKQQVLNLMNFLKSE